MDQLDDFCCVTFVENNKKKMATVPSNWILNGVMYWPKTNWMSELKRLAPPKEKWHQVPNPSILFSGNSAGLSSSCELEMAIALRSYFERNQKLSRNNGESFNKYVKK